MGTLLQDVRYALRQLRRAPGFTVTAIVTLAFGIGVTVTVAALVRQVLLAPLPYPQPQQIVGLAFHWPGQGPNDSMTGIAGEFVMRSTRSYSSMALLGSGSTANFSPKGGHAKSVSVMDVSRGYFNVLGVTPMLGREFSADEDRPLGPKAAIVSYAFWRDFLGGSPGVIGRVIHLNEQSVTVVGVMPRGLRTQNDSLLGMETTTDVWTALQASPSDPGYKWNNYEMIARLRPGITVEQARSELIALQPRLYALAPFYKNEHNREGQTETLQVYPYATIVASTVRPSLLVMAWAAVAVLLLTCLNLAGLNTARALQRMPELSLRISLGASRRRILRLALLEFGVVTLAGIGGAVVLARILLLFLLKLSPIPIPELNGPVGVAALLLIAAIAGLLCAVLVGVPFALAGSLSRRTATGGMQQRGSGVSRMQGRIGRAIVVAQVGLALVLLSVSTMLLGTFLKLRAQPLGFQPQNLVVFHASLNGDNYQTTSATDHFVQRVVERLQQTPGILSASAVVGVPLQRGLNDEGWAAAHPELDSTIEPRAVTPGYLRSMGISQLQGRGITQDDGAAQQHVAVISRATANKLWPRQDAVGQTIYIGEKDPFRVVGIVADTPANQLGQPPDLMVYTPMAQQADVVTKMLNGWFPVSFVAKAEAHIDIEQAAQRAVAEVDPEIPVSGLSTMRDIINHSVAAPRFFTQIAEGFAVFALLLTAIGMFGLLSYQVTQRRREIGIRMALGAGRRRVLSSVLWSSVSMVIAGSVAGALVATLLHPLLARWIMGYVAGLAATQTKYLLNGTTAVGAAILALALTVIAAASLPAWRASKVEPMEALRTE